jgi:hypothetical protein
MNYLNWVRGMSLDMEFLETEDKRIIRQLYNEYVPKGEMQCTQQWNTSEKVFVPTNVHYELNHLTL